MALLVDKTTSVLTNTPTTSSVFFSFFFFFLIGTSSVFSNGNFNVDCRKASNSNSASSSPPKPLLICSPNIKGSYPVVLFLHGFYLRNYFYKELLQLISSSGYIIVAPQLYEYLPPSGQDEIELAANIANWLEEGLQPLLHEKVVADLTKVALAGHSRGGKAAFALALGYAKTSYSLKFSVLVGIDPVAGTGKGHETKPHILNFKPHDFNQSMPVAIIGTGLGPEKNFGLQPCAPDGVNHEEFFKESKPPCAYFVAKGYGHMDMLDDSLSGLFGIVSNLMCKNGKGPRALMRRSVAGIVVAFLKAYLEGDDKDLVALINDPSISPAKLDPVVFVEA